MSQSYKKGNFVKRYKVMKQQGFTLIEMVIVLGLLALVAGIAISQYDGNRGKGVALYSKLKQYGESMKRMKFDTQCYPTKTGALFSRDISDESHCGINLQQNWKGPYVQSTQLDTNDDIAMLEFSESSSLILPPPATADINGSGNRRQWTIIVTNVPDDVINVAMEECNNGYSDDTQTEFKQGQCFIVPNAARGTAVSNPNFDFLDGTSSSNSIGYIFDERA